MGNEIKKCGANCYLWQNAGPDARVRASPPRWGAAAAVVAARAMKTWAAAE